MLCELDLEDFARELASLVNPEVWHFQHGCHPGLGWHIKTVIPTGLSHVFAEWQHMAHRHPAALILLSSACNWHGEPLLGYVTAWVRDGTDIAHDDSWCQLRLVGAAVGHEETRQRLLLIIRTRTREIGRAHV